MLQPSDPHIDYHARWAPGLPPPKSGTAHVTLRYALHCVTLQSVSLLDVGASDESVSNVKTAICVSTKVQSRRRVVVYVCFCALIHFQTENAIIGEYSLKTVVQHFRLRESASLTIGYTEVSF